MPRELQGPEVEERVHDCNVAAFRSTAHGRHVAVLRYDLDKSLALLAAWSDIAWVAGCRH